MRGNIKGQIASGPEDFYHISSSCEIDGQAVSDGNSYEVDPLKALVARVVWAIGNRDPGFYLAWDGVVTTYDMTHSRKLDWNQSDADGGGGTGRANLEIGTMAEPTQIRINIMANQNFHAGEPPLTAWKKRV